MEWRTVLLTNHRLKKLILPVFMLFFMLFVGRFSINPGYMRQLIFISLFILLLAVVLHQKERIIYYLIIYLAFMGLIRRALIPISGWSSFDPLLILGPSLTVVLALLMFWENHNKNNIMREKPDRLMLALFIMGSFQMVNPFSGSPLNGLIGSMYIIIPWLWYFIALYKIQYNQIKVIFTIIEICGTCIALYGLYQTFFGILPFEQDWVRITGYKALYLAEDTVRSIGTFPSAQEFVYFTMITFMVAFSRMIDKKRFLIHFPIVIICLSSIFFASARTIIFFMTLAIYIILIVTKKTAIGKLASAIGIAIIIGVIWNSLSLINPAWFGSAEPAVEHMVEGLVDPLAEDQTGVGHIDRFVEGMKSIVTNPIGHGIASVTKAADKSTTSEAMSTEVDVSNMVVAMGVGGIIYILIIITTIYKTIYLVIKNKKVEYVIILGIFIGGLGSWINGGFYTAPIIIWLLIGWIHKQYCVIRGEKNEIVSS